MEVSSTQQSAAPASVFAPTQTAQELADADFQVFLEMLAVQMQNQDPLNPVDSTDFATQLAQFSALEQQVETNDLLAALGAQMAVSGLSQLAGWVGMEARTIAPANFQGDPITLVPSPAQLSDHTFLIVRDDSGEIVQRKEIPVSPDPIQWDGLDDSGTPFVHGLYSFELESVAAGEILDTTYVENYALIIEAQNINGQTILVMEGGARVDSASITAIRNKT